MTKGTLGMRRDGGRTWFGRSNQAEQEKLDQLWHWVNGMQQTLNSTVGDLHAIRNEVNRERTDSGEHVDLVVDQLWRRLEAADARLATQVQRHEHDANQQLEELAVLSGRLRVENAAILRILGYESPVVDDEKHGAPTAVSTTTAASVPTGTTTETSHVQLPVDRMTLFAEIESSNGTSQEQKYRQFTEFFANATAPVLVIGCGDTRFFGFLQDANVNAYGIDARNDAVTSAIASGFEATNAEVFAHLASLDTQSLSGVFAPHLVETLEPHDITTFYEEMFRVLTPGGHAVVATPNPATFSTHVQSFWRDPAHLRPVPSATLDFVARSTGLITEHLVYLSPMPDNDKLKKIDLGPQDPLLAEIIDTVNRNTDLLNELLFGWQEYALVSRKP